MDGGDYLPNAAELAGRGTTTTTCPVAGWWTRPTSTIVTAPSASTDVMNQLCRVCAEPAAGFHFGAFTCEGCKSFFGRTYNNLASISECKNGGACVINKKNRTACKACRLRKCLMEQTSQVQARLKDATSLYEKAFSSPDAAAAAAAADDDDDDDDDDDASSLPVQGKRGDVSRTQELPLGSQHFLRPRELFRPVEPSRLPLCSPFFYPALSHMQLLRATPFFPFQQRLVVPYVNRANGPRVGPGLGRSSTSSESASPPEGRQQSRILADRSSDGSIAFLRSLGPEQEEPMDLSRNTIRKGSAAEKTTTSEQGEAEAGPALDLARKARVQ